MAHELQSLVVHPGHRSHPGNGPRNIVEDLPTLRELVGGDIEAVYGYRTPEGHNTRTPRLTFFLNEEGKIHQLGENGLATALWWHYNRDAIGQDILVGPVVIVGGADALGNSTALPGDVLGVYTDLISGAYYTGFNY
jgi:hypothetical protein